MRNRIRTRLRGGGQGPWILVAAIAVALLVTPFAIAAGEGRPLLGGKRNPGSNASAALAAETQIIANNRTYGTRQSNKSDNGGGAIYGCRSRAGGSERGNEPCVRARNLTDGRAFEFESSGGSEVGVIRSGNPGGAPFTTNATGVATGLNADEVDGQSAADIVNAGKPLFAAVNASGIATGGRGLAQSAAVQRTGEGAFTVTFGSDVTACAYSATQTTTDNAGSASVEPVAGNANALAVVTRQGGGADGTGPTARADRPFHVIAHC
jgi:hypothetical protein